MAQDFVLIQIDQGAVRIGLPVAWMLHEMAGFI
jgi:hypothetical protein